MNFGEGLLFEGGYDTIYTHCIKITRRDDKKGREGRVERDTELNRVLRDSSVLGTLNDRELERLCEQIRTFLIEHIARTGGHLASNLGVVEISVALALEFDPFRDRILYDVGHQCYVHKLLTGRAEGFGTLRTYGGMSGFPRPWESAADPVVAGHASSALSAAAGLARARTLRHETHRIVTVIGDASVAGGMAMEALNDIGRSEEPLIVILNDNAMAISRSVGGVAEHLNRLRTRPGYYRFKTFLERKVGRRFAAFLKRIKDRIKTLVLPTSLFENMGFTYLGPVDGHNIRELRRMISFAKLLNRPVVIHCLTVKGCGAEYAEHDPDRFHGASAFDAQSGRALSPHHRTFSDALGENLRALARTDAGLCAVTAAMPSGTGLSSFAQEYPERFFDVGIAEEHAVTMSAGLARGGMTPVCAVYSTFLQRAYDQILHDVCIDPVHVVFAVDRAGLVPGDGETHQGLFDVALLGDMPGMTVYAPANFAELELVLRRALYEHTGPVALRYPRGCPGECTFCDGRDAGVLRDPEHPQATLVCGGILVNEALGAAELLAREGVEVRVVKLLRLCPLPDLTAWTDVPMLVAEEAAAAGGIGERAAAALQGCGIRMGFANTGDAFPPCGDVPSLRERFGLDAQSLAAALRALTENET